MGRRLGFLLITSMAGAPLALMLACSAEPTRHSRERGNPKAIDSKYVLASYRILVPRFRGNDENTRYDENRRVETDILKLATLPSERRPAWTPEMRMAIEVKCDATIPPEPVMCEFPPERTDRKAV